MPTDPAGAIDLLTDLPQLEVNLAALPVDRLRPLLDAFAIQINYDLYTNRVTFQATISATAVPHLTRLAHTAIPTQKIHTPAIPRQRTHKRAITSTNTPAPADNGGGAGICSSMTCPAKGTNLRPPTIGHPL
jgi:hypothetical protein